MKIVQSRCGAAPSLEVSMARLDRVWSSLGWWQVPIPLQADPDLTGLRRNYQGENLHLHLLTPPTFTAF